MLILQSKSNSNETIKWSYFRFIKSDEVQNLPLCHKNMESKSIENNSKEVEFELFKSNYFRIEIQRGFVLTTIQTQANFQVNVRHF